MKKKSRREYRSAIEAVGMTQQRAGKLFGIHERTSRRYALGEQEPPEAITLLLRVMIKYKLRPEDVEALG
jgi:hypothetical protein